jgi:hypothetical protein
MGNIEDNNPTIKVAVTARTIVIGSIKKNGKNPFGIACSNPVTIGKVSAKPIPPPRQAINIDSPRINPVK